MTATSRAASLATTAPGSRTWRILAGTSAAVIALLYGGAMLFTSWRDWDDEGYMLLAIGDFARHGGLYERFPTPYGPFFFEFSAAVFRSTGLAFDSTSARIVSGCLWLATAVLLTWAAWRATGRAFVAGAAGFLSVFALDVMANEPLHPRGLSVLLLALLVVLLVARDRGAGRTGAWRSVACGAVVATLVWTKPNVGVLAALAVGVDLLRRVPGPLWNRLARGLALAALVLFPFALTRSLRHVEWVLPFAALAAVSLAPFASTAWGAGGPAASWRELAAQVSGAVLASTAILAVMLASGTTVDGMAEGFLGEALRFPGAFLLPPRTAGPAWTAGAAVLVLASPWLLRAARARDRAAWIGVVRGLASAVVFVAALSSRQPFALWPVLWLVAMPTSSSTRVPGLHPITLLAATQLLHAYPVAGAKVGFFAFLFPLAGALGAWQAWNELPERWRARAMPALRSKALVIAAVVVALVATPVARRTVLCWRDWAGGIPIGVPGSRGLRLSEGLATRLACVATNLERNAATFLGVPGAHSFYAWSRLPPPVPFYPNAWILFWDDERQTPMRDVLAREPRSWVLRNQAVLSLWLRGGPRPGGALWDWIDERRAPWLRVGDYEILAPIGESARPVRVARAGGQSGVLELAFAGERSDTSARVVRLTIVDTRDGRIVGDSQSSDPARALVQLDGAEATGSRERALEPLDLSADRVVRVRAPAALAGIDADDLIVRALDAQGRVVARLPFAR